MSYATICPNPSCKMPPVCSLGACLLIALFLLSSGLVYAEWVLTSGNDETGLLVYVDSESMRLKGITAKMWQLYDYKTVQEVAGDFFMSMKRFNEYDCSDARTRILGYTWFSGNMGNGNVVYSTMEIQPWERVEPGTINYTLWKVACGKN